MYFYSVENVVGLTSFLFTSSQDPDALWQQTLIDRLQSRRAAGHTTSQQVAWALKAGWGVWENELKIATESIRELVQGLLMQQISATLQRLRSNVKDLPNPDHYISISQLFSLKYYVSFFLTSFTVSSQQSDVRLYSCTSSLQNVGGEFGLCLGAGERQRILQGPRAEEGGPVAPCNERQQLAPAVVDGMSWHPSSS